MDEAEKRAWALLKENLRFTVTSAPSTGPASALFYELPPGVQRLLSRYSHIVCNYAEGHLGHEWIKPSMVEGYIAIGYDMDFTEIIVKPDCEEVLVTDREGFLNNDFAKWPSVYHLICYLASP